MYRAGREEIDEIAAVIRSKQWFRVGDPRSGHLREVERFEEEWAERMGVRHALFMSGGGTGALVCALAGLGLGPGDEVIVPAYTWMATATSVLMAGAIPVLAEIDETLGLDPCDVECKMGPSTRAVIPVHMIGRPSDMEALLAMTRGRGVKLVEDACQAAGASYKGRSVGSWGDAGAFSFNHYKILSAGGEGGCLVTDDRETYERAFVYHDSGASFRPQAGDLRIPVFIAQQYRASEVMGALARIQLQRLEGLLRDLRRARDRLAEAVAEADGVKEAPSNDRAGECGVTLPLQFQDEKTARRFAASPGVAGFMAIDHGKHVHTHWEPLREKRIGHHPAMNPFGFEKNKGLRADYGEGVCPRTLDILRRTLLIPIHPDWSEDECAMRAEALRTAARNM